MRTGPRLALALLALAACSGPGDGPGRRDDPDPTVSTDEPLVRRSYADRTDADGFFRVEVEVPPGVTHFQVSASAGHDVYLEELYDPDGERVLYWEDWYDSPRSLTDAFFGFDDTTAFDWPVRATDGPLATGTWTVVESLVNDRGFYVADAPVDVSVWRKRDPDPAAATVSVQIVWAEGVDDDPAVVAAVAAAVERWREVWGRYGITLRERYVASTLDPSMPYARKGGEPEVARIAEGRTPGELQVIVGEMVGESRFLYGIAAGIPGTLESTDLTYVALSWLACAGRDAVFDEGETRLMGETMAHEVGHYAGLFHPVEGDYEAWDALEDTPECGRYRDCVDVLGDNVMYPFSVCDRQGCLPTDQLTPDQLGVLHGYIGAL